jgi:nicotinate-nucleotide adenylyltransferase
MSSIGLFFGSFNPIHTGHLILAEYFATHCGLDEVWLVVSPNNPFKSELDLYPQADRLHWVHLAIADNPHLKACDIEFSLSSPSYTIHTLNALSQVHPSHSFSLIMGQDNLESFHRWKAYEEILTRFPVLVYPRHGCSPCLLQNHPSVRMVDAPLLEISATRIRSLRQSGHSIRYLIPDPVYRLWSESPR